jgi:hypothetical protein
MRATMRRCGHGRNPGTGLIGMSRQLVCKGQEDLPVEDLPVEDRPTIDSA